MKATILWCGENALGGWIPWLADRLASLLISSPFVPFPTGGCGLFEEVLKCDLKNLRESRHDVNLLPTVITNRDHDHPLMGF